MNLANVGQAISLSEWTTIFYLVLAGATTITCLWFLRTLAHANRVQDRTPSPERGAHLRQVYPTKDDPEVVPGPDIDIIAIHGLDTNSPDTWKWKGPGNRETEDPTK